MADCLPTPKQPRRREINMAAACAERQMPDRLPIVACGPDRAGRYALFLVRDDLIISSGLAAEEVDEARGTVTVGWTVAPLLAEWMTKHAALAKAVLRH